MKCKIYDDDVLKHIQDVELMILKDFIKICEENNLDYYLFFGTHLGAVRHKGFIPWDDDIDIMMFREDYEKFLKIMESLNSNKYEVLDCRYKSDYFFQFGKLCLIGTHTSEEWDNQISYKTGIHIDLFILDKVPNNKIKSFIFIRRCFILNKLYALSTIKFEGYSKIIQLITGFMHYILNHLGFTSKYFQKRVSKVFRKYEHDETNFVSDLTLNEKLRFKISDFEPHEEVIFEDIIARIPKESDDVLRRLFGDYMKLPPEEERFNHALDTLDFGKY